MKKFGSVLNSRPAGHEALLAISPHLTEKKDGEELAIDFKGVDVLTPSFADEFITPLVMEHNKNELRLTNTQKNITVRKTLAFLAEEWDKKVVME
ncbi:STAS-like domain-containing protein [Patescibacteria group bacterium]|nr:STAS-like domain-containing protein [Patescibacteria group bacterium]